MSPPSRLASRLAWTSLVATILVVLFGAWVRITGSGAGCGQHWPTCHGEILPRTEAMETVIEFTHRASSGLYGFLILGLVIVAFRSAPRGHWLRRGAVLALLFTISEALVGARLVLLGLVADNDSIDRAIWMAIHLVNTSLLTGGVTIACWASAAAEPRLRPQGRHGWLLMGGVGLLLLVGVTGAITALGDTLFPVDAAGDLVDRLRTDHSPTANFLQRLRVMHPIMAIGVGLYLIVVAQAVAERRRQPRILFWSRLVVVMVFLQVAAGLVNIGLSAPGWMQIIHLLLANVLWIGLSFLTLEVLSQRPEGAS